jgi:hypothetical protein
MRCRENVLDLKCMGSKIGEILARSQCVTMTSRLAAERLKDGSCQKTDLTVVPENLWKGRGVGLVFWPLCLKACLLDGFLPDGLASGASRGSPMNVSIERNINVKRNQPRSGYSHCVAELISGRRPVTLCAVHLPCPDAIGRAHETTNDGPGHASSVIRPLCRFWTGRRNVLRAHCQGAWSCPSLLPPERPRWELALRASRHGIVSRLEGDISDLPRSKTLRN